MDVNWIIGWISGLLLGKISGLLVTSPIINKDTLGA